MDRSEQKERDKLFRQSLGKFFIDLSKLVFAGVVVGGVVQLSNSSNLAFSVIMILFGLVASSFLAYVGFLILRWYGFNNIVLDLYSVLYILHSVAKVKQG